jgi:hypothetical protein
LSISNINTKGPLNQTQRAQLKTAREVKQNVLKTTKRFQGLDETPADLAKDDKDVVLVGDGSNTTLPQSTGNKIARLAVGVLAPKEESSEASGLAVTKDGKLDRANIKTEAPDGKESEIQYRKLEDGTEIYHGPTKDGYAVVRENKDGTLMMMTSDKPAAEAYYGAHSWKAPAEVAAPAEEVSPKKTFADTLKDLASGQQATGPGTVAGREKAETTDAQITAPAKRGFLAPFGETAANTVDQVKQGGENLVKDMGDSLKDASETVGEKSKSVTQSVKDWSQSDTGQNIGDLLFGIANPWKKKG